MSWVRSHPFLSALTLLLAVVVVTAIIGGQNRQPDWVTATVERGDVREIVTVSGTVEASELATLSFPTSGVVATIDVERGDTVEAGAMLATLGDSTVAAERRSAVASVAEAEAARAELMAGQTDEAAAVTGTTLANAKAALTQTQTTARTQVENALQNLLSTDLEAVAVDPNEAATPPTIDGNYTCGTEGEYRIEVYRSSANSGYSYRVTGLERYTASASTEQPAPFGSCGLTISFTEGDSYSGSEWVVSVPNPRSNTYIARQNAYTLAVAQAEQNVAAARDAVRLAEDTATQATAGARVEALLAANARVQQAQARLQQIDVRLQERALYAPFAGMVTNVHANQSEVVALGTPVIDLVATEAFELVARVPEIDITKLTIGQSATAVFDAEPETPVTGTVTFVSPAASTIDGVGYFETIITFTNTPDWMLAGLNADIDIVLGATADTLRVPTRFIQYDDEQAYVLTPNKQQAVRTMIEIIQHGNDGYTAVSGIDVDTTVIAP